ncbi:MAG: radical SAM protein [Chloroflexi bacterium]|nr:radical SAM protein [Chloroflexota bacterium]
MSYPQGRRSKSLGTQRSPLRKEYRSESIPRYVGLYQSGELQRRSEALESRLASCDICPRDCRVDRLHGKSGFCRSGHLPVVSSVCDHHGEEPVISGTKGTGAIFFGNCNLKCVYCQNHQISQDAAHQQGKDITPRQLAERMMYLQDVLGCHNISFVSPSHFVPQLVTALCEAVPRGLRVPLVYNTNSYDSVDVLKQMDGIIDLYLPDLKYADDKLAVKYSQAAHYVQHARESIKEMYRQVGDLALDDAGLARSGVIVRHLILPNELAGSRESLGWLAREVSPSITVSVMAQYYPVHRAPRVPLLSRRISAAEYAGVLDMLDEFKLQNGWVQGLDAAENYQPDFQRQGHPFVLSRAV